MRRGKPIPQHALALGVHPRTIVRAVERVGLFVRSHESTFNAFDVAQGLALLAEDGERAARRDAFRKMCGALENLFAELAKIAALLRSKITQNNPTGRIPGTKKK